MAPMKIYSSLNQSLALPSSSTYSSEPRKTAIDNRPHQSNFLNRLEFRLVEVDEIPGDDRDDDAGNDIDEEQPVPGKGMAEITADRRADGRRQRRDKADDRRDDAALGGREDREGGCEDRRDHAAADETLQRAVDDHLVDIGRRLLTG